MHFTTLLIRSLELVSTFLCISYVSICSGIELLHVKLQAPNATNSLCGYKIVTGQPSDRLGEDFSEHYKDLTER